MASSTINPDDPKAVAKCFSEFKEMLTLLGKLDASHNDVLLMRFLRARQYSIPLATQMFTECQEWRLKTNVDSLVESFAFPEVAQVAQIYPRFYVCVLFSFSCITLTLFLHSIKPITWGVAYI